MLRVRERPNSDFTIVGLTPSPATTATDVQNFLSSVTGLSSGSIFVSGPSTFEINYSNGTANTTAAQAPLLAAAGGVDSSTNAPGENHLTQAQLDSVVMAAIDRWSAAGLSAAQLATLHQVTFQIADLADNKLAVSGAGNTTVDADAAGYGWFIDPTPGNDVEFGHAAGSTHLTTDPTTAAAGHMDLLTTVMHEFGLQLGLDDLYASDARDDLMFAGLTTGERRLPGADNAMQVEQTAIANAAVAAEAALPTAAAASVNTPIVPGTAGNDTFHIGQGGLILAGGGGADTFAFDPAILTAPAAPVTHIADYSAAQGDVFDFSALQVADATKVRVLEDASNAFATLQVQAAGAAADSWINLAQLDGVHAGDPVNVALDAAHVAYLHAGVFA
jgi:hypothetical protein